MRTLWLTPITYLAGIHGFAYFVPYLVLIGLLAMATKYARRLRRELAPVRVPVLELKPAAA